MPTSRIDVRAEKLAAEAIGHMVSEGARRAALSIGMGEFSFERPDGNFDDGGQRTNMMFGRIRISRTAPDSAGAVGCE